MNQVTLRDSFGAQLGINPACAIDAVILLAQFDHSLTTFGVCLWGISLERFGAQLGIDLACAIDAVILFALFDHPLPAFGVCLRRLQLIID
jgi:hypothetical protein